MMIILDYYKNVDIDKLVEERLYKLMEEQKKRENKEIADYLLDRSKDLKLLARVIEDLATELNKEEVSDTKVRICLLTLEALGKKFD
ncbi:hypothetical protein [Clostridium sp.]|uniref:hypothetical protein n=1 Tax=Clostridium sp. TaxID=1506 RepID=UPI0029005079|nr:hypothetical protein [Clostridium sp.]MDU1968858.1 hypothetical protein [Clostridium perfringens]MDU1822390.1 hypothetical protein [Clostridium sp.]MDU1841556.1 hypothetical protein [Clostridium sp.]MDU2689632.1 hypothetical protein [Clostridium sp.]MDU2955815.1 hypothetical protein [Clostridium sp.]